MASFALYLCFKALSSGSLRVTWRLFDEDVLRLPFLVEALADELVLVIFLACDCQSDDLQEFGVVLKVVVSLLVFFEHQIADADIII